MPVVRGWKACCQAGIAKLATKALRRNLKITLAYDGTRFVGWQRQADGESIQGWLEDTLARFEGAPLTVHGAGRTDAGVHALGQVASVSVTFTHPAETIVRALNAQLPEEIRIIDVVEAPADFHARFSARSKTYRYQLRAGGVADPFTRAYTWQMPETLDVEAMRAAASMLVGTHDFAAFQSVGTETSTSVRTISRSEFTAEGAAARYEVAGDGFLRPMLRAVVGTLVEIGRGWRSAGSMAELLTSGSRAEAGATAPPHGLFLVRVDYD